jgi:hypothetical protein
MTSHQEPRGNSFTVIARSHFKQARHASALFVRGPQLAAECGALAVDPVRCVLLRLCVDDTRGARAHHAQLLIYSLQTIKSNMHYKHVS